MKTPSSFRHRGNASPLVRNLLRTTCCMALAGALAQAQEKPVTEATTTAASPALPVAKAKGQAGLISGKVSLASNGQALRNAIVHVMGTNIEVLTNEFGEYSLAGVDAGKVILVVSFTGQSTQTTELELQSGEAATKDFALKREGEGNLMLETFRAEEDRFRNAQEIAANEELQSVSIKNVVSTDSLGFVADGNIGDFVQFIPGVDIGTGGTYVNGSDTSSINVRGFGAENTAITIDGMPISSPSPASLTRAVSLDMISINNASMIEVIKVASPEQDSNSPGGSINLVTRNAFDYAKPRYNVDLTASMNSEDLSFFSKRPGPANKETYHMMPGLRVSASYPFSKTLGATVSLSSDNKYTPNESTNANYVYAPFSYGGVVIKNSVGESSLVNPYLSRITYTSNPWNTFKQAGNVKVDWKPTRNMILNAKVEYSQYTGVNVGRRLQFTAGSPTDWTGDYVVGRLYENVSGAKDPGNKAAMTIEARDKAGDTLGLSLKFNYKLGYWALEANGSRSTANGRYDDMKNGHFSGIDMKFSPGKVDFDRIVDSVPAKVSIYDRSGAMIDYSKLESWTVDGTLVAKSGEAFQKDIMDKANINLSRELPFRWASFSIKTGYSYSAKDQRKWGRGTGYKSQYVGPKLSSTAMIDEVYQLSPGYGMPKQQWFDVYKLYQLYSQDNALFDPNYSMELITGNYVSATNQTKSVKEMSNAYFVQLDGRFFRNRLSIRTGVRKQQSEIEGYQPMTDSKYNMVKNADGTVYKDDIYINGVRIDGGTTKLSILGSDGKQINSAADAMFSDASLVARMKAAGAVVPDHISWGYTNVAAAGLPPDLRPTVGVVGTTANNLELAQLKLAPRTIKRKRSNPQTPMASASYKLTPNLALKASWSRETTLPNLEDAGTAGILAANGSLTIDESAQTVTDENGEIIGTYRGVISASNSGLKPEVTNSYNLGFNYRTKSGGALNGNFYYKITENLWEDLTINNTSPVYNDVLIGLGLDPGTYDDWLIKTTVNGVDSAKRWGIELDARQNLGFLGTLGKRFNVWAAYTHKSANPTTIQVDKLNVPYPGQFQLKSRDIVSAGVSFSAKRFSVQVSTRWLQSAYSRNSTRYKYNGLEYVIYNDSPADWKTNVQFSYRLSNNYSAFLSVNNVFDKQPVRRVYDPLTRLIPQYAWTSSQQVNGMQINMGVSGTW